MRKDVREFIRRLEAVGLTVESTPRVRSDRPSWDVLMSVTFAALLPPRAQLLGEARLGPLEDREDLPVG
jgi:hypothetical protein